MISEEKKLNTLLEKYDLVYVEEMGIIWKTRLRAISKVASLALSVLAARTVSAMVFARKYHNQRISWFEALKRALPNLSKTEITLLTGLNLLFTAGAYIVWRYSNECYRKCLSVKDLDPRKTELKRRICEAECRLASYKRILTEARTEMSKCGSTGNPGKCRRNLRNFIIKYEGKSKVQQNSIDTNKKLLEEIK